MNGSQTPLAAEARVALAQPRRALDALLEHGAEHDFVVRREGARGEIALKSGRGLLASDAGHLALRVEAPDLAALLSARLWLASHLLELARDEAPRVVWEGDGSAVTVPPNFRAMRVAATRPLTPHMRRLTLQGADLARFDAHDLHLKLLVPLADDAEPPWPTLGPDGLLAWAEGPRRPSMRTYTIRRIDAAAGEIDVDFVLHEDGGQGDGGPGAAFARRARPGDPVGILGPGGLNAAPADWTLLAGDETALPAMARILEAMPRDARGLALIEVADEWERQEIAAPPGVTLRWLSRDGAPAGTSATLADAVLDAAPPATGTAFAWAGCEFAAFARIRRHWRNALRLSRDHHLAVSYWRRGHSRT